MNLKVHIFLYICRFVENYWCPRTNSNREPIDYKSIALPVELQGHRLFCRINSLFIQVIQLKSLYDLKTSLSRNKRSIVLNSY